jgi:hypothetical protein
MNRMRILKITMVLTLALALFGAGILTGKNTFHQPSSIIHVVTVKWKAESTAEQQQAALDGVKTMAAEIPGIKSIWKAAADRYVDHPAHKAWQKIYEPVHEESRSLQITN